MGVPSARRLRGNFPVCRSPDSALKLIEEADFRYRFLTRKERDAQILKIINILEEPIERSGPNRQDVWEQGWEQNLKDFVNSGYDARFLLPYYYRRGRTIMRLRDDYVLPASETFEADFLNVLQHIIAKSFFERVPAVYEYGCGPGHNLLSFSHVVPGKKYHGFDWAEASGKILELIETKMPKTDPASHFAGHFIDLFHPHSDEKMIPGSAALTFGAMEQLGLDYHDFLAFLWEQPASVFIHIEPFSELRCQDLLLDVLADRYAKKRNYLSGYLQELESLQMTGKLQIVAKRKLLGSTFYDGWCLVVWKRL